MEDKATIQTQSRYNRIAPFYDLMEAIVERLVFQRWREMLWSRARGERVLEVGVGTGKNLPYDRQGIRMAAVDMSERMLE